MACIASTAPASTIGVTISVCRFGTATSASVVPVGQPIREPEGQRRDVEAVAVPDPESSVAGLDVLVQRRRFGGEVVERLREDAVLVDRPAGEMIDIDGGGRIGEIEHEDGQDAGRDVARDGLRQLDAAHRLVRHEPDAEDRLDLLVVGRERVEVPALHREQAREVGRDDARPVAAVGAVAELREVGQAELVGLVGVGRRGEDDAIADLDRHAAPLAGRR